MKRTLCALLALWACLCFCASGLAEAATTTPDYTVEGKLFRQLEAGSGFSGALTLSLSAQEGHEAEALTTAKPLVFDVSYILVREDAQNGIAAQRRYDLTLQGDNAPLASLSLAALNDASYLKSDLLNAGWYTLPKTLPAPAVGNPATDTSATVGPAASTLTTDTSATIGPTGPAASGPAVGGPAGPAASTLTTDTSATIEPTGPAASGPAVGGPAVGEVASDESSSRPFAAPLESALDQSALPALFRLAIPALLEMHNHTSQDLSAALNTYITKVDLWIEGYRQNAVLGKLEDGTSTMEVAYSIPAAALKAQIKQMLMDILSDTALLPKLQAMLPAEQSALLLEPKLQSYYFYAIDELPLEGNLTISRTVSLKGNTLALHINLPLYDQQAGAVTLSYDRKTGTGKDLPDENLFSLESRDLLLQLEYQAYQTMTDMTVYQGTLRREPRGPQTFQEEQNTANSAPKTLSAAFTLSHQQIDGIEDKYETLTHDYKVSLEPLLSTTDAAGKTVPLTEAEKAAYYVFPAFDLAVNAVYKSKQEKNAPTSVDVTLSLSGESIPQILNLSFSGKTKAKWTPDAVDTTKATDVSAMAQEELSALLMQSGVKAGLLFLPLVKLPEPAPSSAVDAAVTDGPTADEQTADEQTAGPPAADGATADGPTADEPTAGPPAADGPTASPPTADEPTAGPAGADGGE